MFGLRVFCPCKKFSNNIIQKYEFRILFVLQYKQCEQNYKGKVEKLLKTDLDYDAYQVLMGLSICYTGRIKKN